MCSGGWDWLGGGSKLAGGMSGFEVYPIWGICIGLCVVVITGYGCSCVVGLVV